jgi:large subunit ribosomal protein L5
MAEKEPKPESPEGKPPQKQGKPPEGQEGKPPKEPKQGGKPPEAGEGKPEAPREGKGPKEQKQGGKPPKDAAAGKKPEKGKPAPPPKPTVPARLQERYQKEIIKQLADKLRRTNRHSLPKLQKIVVNMGVGKAVTGGDKNRIEQAAEQLGQITGQKAQIRKARVAVSGFRLREGMEIGCRVTLRGRRMYEFLDRLISIALPRIRDFRGINPKSFDGQGNYSMGLAEQLVFPEIDPDKTTFTQGMDITMVTSTHSDDEARELLRMFGMPFRES